MYGDSRFPNPEAMPPKLETIDGQQRLLDMLARIKELHPTVKGVVEFVGGYVGEEQPGSSMFKFGSSTNGLKMALTATGIPYIEIAPVSWQRHFDLPKRGRTSKGKTQHKRDLKQEAERLFPENKVTLKTADAFLLYHLAYEGII